MMTFVIDGAFGSSAQRVQLAQPTAARGALLRREAHDVRAQESSEIDSDGTISAPIGMARSDTGTGFTRGRHR